ncbi:unnamed protein product [Caenorhabditis sp. 36 PRJEB53466]|nr:unnamed protein product [Caenorhabditis sp. 36 PRJEB53466]
MREDIQSLRGIALVFVFLYHLFPTLFVNGFLGVDIFFVITGYLMANHLTRSKICSLQYNPNIIRFKRVLPLHFVVLFISLILVHFYLGEHWWEVNNDYGLASLFLATNQFAIHNQADYFTKFVEDRSSMNAFAHLWSLSVEMQFYILVPFVFFALQFFNNDLLRLITVSVITFIGLISFLLFDSLIAFNFMLLRFWQFSAGFVALFWNRVNINTGTDDSRKRGSQLPAALVFTREDLVTAALLLISLCLLPAKLNVPTLRPFITLATALIISAESKSNKFLQLPSLVYLGNLSYAVYLVHWPIIAVFIGTTVKSYAFCIVSSILLSMFLHHFFEKRYEKLDVKPAVLLIAILFFTNGYLHQSVRRHHFWRHTLPAHLESIVERNKEFLPSLWDREPRKDPCEERTIPDLKDRERVQAYCRYPKGNGTFSIMMIGNRCVLNMGEHIRAHFNYNYSDYRYISADEGYGLYSDGNKSAEALRIQRWAVEEHRPDVLLIVSRYSASIQSRITEHDAYLRQMNENIAFYEQFVKKVYILDHLPHYQVNFLNKFMQYATRKPDELESLHLDKYETEQRMKNGRKRFSLVKCQKCRFFDLSHVFIEQNKYLTFDQEQLLAYADNGVEITAHGMKLCEPVFEKIAKEIMQSF